MRTVGIIGGLGPATTATFYEKLVLRLDAMNLPKRPGILIYSVELDYEVERQAIVEGHGQKRIVPTLCNAARKLAAAGADFLVMPCNSLHVFAQEIRDASVLPLLSIVDESVAALRRQHPVCTALLGSRITLVNELYQRALEQNGLPYMLPSETQMAEIASLVHALVLNGASPEKSQVLSRILGEMAQAGATDALLACTDLQLALSGDNALNITDTFAVLLESALNAIIEAGLEPLPKCARLTFAQRKSLQLSRVGSR